MKKHIALILALALSVALFAGCGENGGTDTSAAPVPSDGTNVSSAPDISMTPVVTHEDSGFIEIPLDMLTNPRYIAVDESGNIYVDNADTVYVIGADKNLVMLIEGLTACRGLSIVSDTLYVFDARDELYLLSYDLQGNIKSEQRISLPTKANEVWRGYVFKSVPVVFISFSANSMVEPHLFSMETQVAQPIENAYNYGMLWPVADGRIIGISQVAINKTDILSVNPDGSVSAAPAPEAYGGLVNFLHDYGDEGDYTINGGEVIFLSEKGDRTSLFSLDSPLFTDSVLVNKKLYLLTPGDSGTAIIVYGIPVVVKQRTLSIMDDGSYLNGSMMKYIEYFKIQHPEIDVRLVPVSYANKKLKLMSGELDVDIILTWEEDVYVFTMAGIASDLSIYPEILAGLKNPNLYEGVLENSINSDGAIIGVPCWATYRGFIVNKPLLDRLGLDIPMEDWTTDDFYHMAMNAAQDLDDDGLTDTYLYPTFKSDVWRLSQNGIPIDFTGIGLNSSNGYKPRYDTPEAIDFIEKCKEIVDLFPFFDFNKAASNDEMTEAERSDNALFQILHFADFKKLTPEQLSRPLLSFPTDIYGNRTTPFRMYWSIYSRAENADLAAMFIAEFLDEEWQYANAKDLYLYKDLSKYARLDAFPDGYEELIARETKCAIRPLYSSYHEVYQELEDKYFAGEITAPQFASEIQKQIERRMLG